jgi:undecaprenyl-diphosphatase
MNAEQQEVTRNAKRFSISLLIVIGIFLLSLAVFFIIANEIFVDQDHEFDHWVFAQVKPLINEGTTAFMTNVTFFGSSLFLLPAYSVLVIYFLTVGKNRKLAFHIAAIGITSRLIQTLAKWLFKRDRPDNPLIQNVEGFSFPSGHSFSGFTFFAMLIYVLWNIPINKILKWVLTVIFFLFACTIAFSRVYLRVHYASDIIAGFFLCLTWLSVSFYILNRLSRNNKT